MAGHTRDKESLPDGVADGAAAFDRSDGLARDDQLRVRRAEADRKGEGLDHYEGMPSGQPLSVEEALRDALHAADPGLSEAQARHAASLVAPLLTADGLAEEDILAFVSISLAYEHEIAKGTGALVAQPTLADFEATKRVADYLSGEVEACRLKLFEARTVPFRTLDAASEWSRGESDRHSLAQAEYDEIATRLGAIALPGSPLRVNPERRYVLLRPPSEATLPAAATRTDLAARMGAPRWLFLAGRSVSLGHLSDVQQRLAEQAGVEEWEITRFVLLGLPPAVQPWRARVPEARWLRGSPGVPLWFNVEIRNRHLAYEEIRSLFSSLVRDGLLEPAPASTQQRDKLERLREFVTKRRYHRSPPQAWTDIAHDWNEVNPNEHYTVRAIQRAYKKICTLRGEQKPPTMRGRRRRLHPPE
jgi:hypothetical protein